MRASFRILSSIHDGTPSPIPAAAPRFSTKFDKFEPYGGQAIPANKQRLIPTSGRYPKGFTVGSTRAGIKPAGNLRPDLVIVASYTPASGAAVFTRNEFCAASVTVSRELMRRTNGAGLRGVIVNSGCANTLTGQVGGCCATVQTHRCQ